MVKWITRKTTRWLWGVFGVTFCLYLLWGDYYLPGYMISGSSLENAQVSIVPYPYSYSLETTPTKAEAQLIRRWVSTLRIEKSNGDLWYGWLSLKLTPPVGKPQYFGVLSTVDSPVADIYMTGHKGVYAVSSKDMALTKQVQEMESLYNSNVVYNNEAYGFRLALPLEWADKIAVQQPDTAVPNCVAVLACPWRDIPAVAWVTVWQEESWKAHAAGEESYRVLGEKEGKVVVLIFPNQAEYGNEPIHIVNWTNRYIGILKKETYEFSFQ